MTATVRINRRELVLADESLLHEVGALVDEAIEKGATFTERDDWLFDGTECKIEGGDPDASGRLATALTALARGANEASVVVPMLRRLD